MVSALIYRRMRYILERSTENVVVCIPFFISLLSVDIQVTTSLTLNLPLTCPPARDSPLGRPGT
jgi:hypothetical protein